LFSSAVGGARAAQRRTKFSDRFSDAIRIVRAHAVIGGPNLEYLRQNASIA
jgi:hypothetical protein